VVFSNNLLSFFIPGLSAPLQRHSEHLCTIPLPITTEAGFAIQRRHMGRLSFIVSHVFWKALVTHRNHCSCPMRLTSNHSGGNRIISVISVLADLPSSAFLYRRFSRGHSCTNFVFVSSSKQSQILLFFIGSSFAGSYCLVFFFFCPRRATNLNSYR